MSDQSNLSEAKRSLLEKYLRGEMACPPEGRSRIVPRPPSDIAPLSLSQQQVWLHHHIAPDDVPVYNETLTIHRSGPLQVRTLERTVAEIIRRHEIWRTTFEMVDGRPVQLVHPPETAFTLRLIDLSDLPEAMREDEAVCLACQHAVKPFDLSAGPLMRALLVKFEEDQHRVFMTFHQLIFDGVTAYQVFLPELAAIYKAFSENQPSPLPEPRIQYADYAWWQQDHVDGESIASQRNYWQTKLGGELPVLDWPIDRPRPSVQSYRGEIQRAAFSGELARKLRVLSQTEGASLFMILVAGLSALLHRYTGQDDILLGAPTAGRKLPEVQGMLGYFLNVLPLRMDLTGNPTFRELLRRVRATVLEALSNQDVPFAQLIEKLAPRLDPSRNPLFQIAISLEPPAAITNDGWRASQSDIPTGASKLDLYIDLDETRDSIVGPVTYNPDLFDDNTIRSMIAHWRTLLESAADDPECRLSELPILTTNEKRTILYSWNQTEAEYPRDKRIHEIFDAQCDLTPDAVAVRDQNKNYTFRQLRERSNSIASYLRNRGAGPGSRIALHLEPSVETVLGLLGILKTGAAYVPLDPSYPTEWISFVLKDSGAAIVLTQEKLAGKLPAHQAQTICLDRVNWEMMPGLVPGDPACVIQPEEAAYVLYTSGSTGRPKGVEGTHRGCLNRLGWMRERYPYQGGEVCCQKTNLGFVDSVAEIFGPLLAGIPNVIIPSETLHDPEALLQTLAEEGVSRIVVVPSLLRMLLEHAPQLEARVPRLQLWSCSGEVLPRELVERFRSGFPGARLLNLYGSAEVAADVTWHEVGEGDGSASSISIGKPISNMQVYILDEQMNPVAIGVRGEIYVGGEGLARGYWRRPELTAERFVANPFAPRGEGARLYRTGDLGRFRANGEIEYLGRVDNQVKLRGMRIELGEIEAVLAGHAGVEEAVVGVSGEGEQQRLVAYLRCVPGGVLGAGELRRYVRGKLPEHMVPASYRAVEQWPLLPSGKVDRKAVAAVAGEALGEVEAVAGPRSEVEGKLVAMWKELLKQEAIGIDQNFFELGGHSLLGLQVMARIRSIFEVELPLRSLFEESTIAGLAAEVEKAQRLGLKARPPIQSRRARTGISGTESALAPI